MRLKKLTWSLSSTIHLTDTETHLGVIMFKKTVNSFTEIIFLPRKSFSDMNTFRSVTLVSLLLFVIDTVFIDVSGVRDCLHHPGCGGTFKHLDLHLTSTIGWHTWCSQLEQIMPRCFITPRWIMWMCVHTSCFFLIQELESHFQSAFYKCNKDFEKKFVHCNS